MVDTSNSTPAREVGATVSIPVTPELAGSEVHVWRAPLQVPADVRELCDTWLSDDEQAQVARFQVERLRRRFIVRRGLRRALFFQYWTCKEAWIKAAGGGLSIPLQEFEVQLRSSSDPAPITPSAKPSGRPLGYVYRL